jgi:CBS domain-containing protein
MFGSPFLVFIAVFVFVAAQQEAVLAETRAALAGVPVAAAMVTHFQVIDADAPTSQALALLLSSDQNDFPVMRGGRIAGMLTRTDLVRGLAGGQRELTVASLISPSCVAAEASEPLDAAFRRMQESGCASLPVVRDGELVGVIALEHVSKWLLLRRALGRPPQEPVDTRGRSAAVGKSVTSCVLP